MRSLLFILTFPFLLTSCNLSRTNFAINDEAMLPNISVGSHIKTTKHIDKLDYGDIVVSKFDGKIEVDKEINDLLKSLNKDEYYHEFHGYIIYRIVGLPGDSIAVKNDTCIINGKKNQLSLIRKGTSNKDIDSEYRQYIEEYDELLPNGKSIQIYLYSSKFVVFAANKTMETIKIPENHYFLMGDFRGEALDSRHFGPITRDQIIGKAIKITPK